MKSDIDRPGEIPSMGTPDTPIHLIDLNEVMKRTGLRRDSVYRLAKLGRMPRPVKPTKSASRWVAHEVDTFVQNCIAARDANASTVG